MIKIKRQTRRAREKKQGKRDGKIRRGWKGEWGSLFVGERRNREEGGGSATQNLALNLLSPPPVTRLKIKIKIK